MTEERQPKGISRRTVAKGAAWAIPAIPFVVAAPAYAGSPPNCVTLTLEGCRDVGGQTKDYSLKICNTCTYPITITGAFSNAKELSTTPVAANDPVTTYTITLEPGQCDKPKLYSGSSAQDIWAEFTVNGSSFETNHLPIGPKTCIDF